MSLTPQQERFCQEYLIDLNATAAYGRVYANCTAASANASASRMLTNTNVSNRIAELQRQRSKQTRITSDRILRELGRIAFSDVRQLYRDDGTLKDLHEWGDDLAAAVVSVETEEKELTDDSETDSKPKRTVIRKTKRFDKIRALELLCRHLGMFDEPPPLPPPAHRIEVSKLPDDLKRGILEALHKQQEEAAAGPPPPEYETFEEDSGNDSSAIPERPSCEPIPTALPHVVTD